jgi:hypothetical protein
LVFSNRYEIDLVAGEEWMISSYFLDPSNSMIGSTTESVSVACKGLMLVLIRVGYYEYEAVRGWPQSPGQMLDCRHGRF